MAHRHRRRLSSTSSVYVFILYLLVTAADDFDASRDVQVIGSRFSDCSLLGNLVDLSSVDCGRRRSLSLADDKLKGADEIQWCGSKLVRLTK